MAWSNTAGALGKGRPRFRTVVPAPAVRTSAPMIPLFRSVLPSRWAGLAGHGGYAKFICVYVR